MEELVHLSQIIPMVGKSLLDLDQLDPGVFFATRILA